MSQQYIQPVVQKHDNKFRIFLPTVKQELQKWDCKYEFPTNRLVEQTQDPLGKGGLIYGTGCPTLLMPY